MKTLQSSISASRQFTTSMSRQQARLTPNTTLPSSLRCCQNASTPLFTVRFYASKPPSKGSPLQNEAAEAAAKKVHQEKVKAAAERAAVAKPVVPEKVIIFNAGAGRTSFLGLMRVSTFVLGVFFCAVAVPQYYNAGEPELTTLGVALAGLVPVTLVGLFSGPFVTHLHLYLPPLARSSRAALERYVANLPGETRLDVTTISPIGKPIYSSMQVKDLSPKVKRLGTVNYVRAQESWKKEQEARKWYMFRAKGEFFVQPQKTVEGVKGKRKGVVEKWIWEAVREKLAEKEAVKAVTTKKP